MAGGGPGWRVNDIGEQGEAAAVYPEGTRRHGPDIGQLFDGTAYLAVKLGVPIVPVAVGGSEEILASGKKLPRLHRVSVRVGAPIHPPADASTRKRTDLAARLKMRDGGRAIAARVMDDILEYNKGAH